MIEIQCTSCHTRYRIDERMVPDDTATFKCSRCGHVFSADPAGSRPKPAERSEAKREPEESRPSVSEWHRPLAPGQPRPLPVGRLAAQAAQRGPQERAGAAGKTPDGWLKTFETRGPAEPSKDEAPATAPRPDVAPPAGEASAAHAAGNAGPGNDPLASAAAPHDEAAGHTGLRHGAAPGENLRFDFGADPEFERGAVFGHAPAGDWKVGDEVSPLGHGDSRARAPDPRESRAYGDAPALKRARLPEAAAFLERGRLRSAGFFLGLFFAVALIFTAATLVICGVPAASADRLRRLPVIGPRLEAPVPLESMVSVGGVRASYEIIKDGHRALVVSGEVRNASAAALRTVQIGVRLLDAGRLELSSGAAYCGNTLSRKMAAEMTPHEVEFLQRLGPPKGFALQPADSAPFLLVFIDPPTGARRFSLGVLKALPAPSARNF